MEIQRDRVIHRSTSSADFTDLMKLWYDSWVMRWVGFPNGLGYDNEAAQAWLATDALITLYEIKT